MTGADVYAYDIVSGQTRALSALSGDQVAPVVSGTRVAWVDASLSLPKDHRSRHDRRHLHDGTVGLPPLNTYGRNALLAQPSRETGSSSKRRT